MKNRVTWLEMERTYYARGKDMRSETMTSAMQIVADRETPTRQCTRVAVPSNFPFSGALISSRLDVISRRWGNPYQ